MKLGVARSQKVKTAGGRIGQWWTDPQLAALFAGWSGIRPGMRVLDAGAGKGALSIAALELGAEVTALEVDRRLADHLERELGDRVRVVHADFLERDTRTPTLFEAESMRSFDLVIANPIWEGTGVEDFLIRACELAARTTAIAPLNLLSGGMRSTFWRTAPVRPTRGKALSTRPRFLGTKGGMRDVMFLEVVPRRHGGLVEFPIEVG